jgi:hypothetical protein
MSWEHVGKVGGTKKESEARTRAAYPAIGAPIVKKRIGVIGADRVGTAESLRNGWAHTASYAQLNAFAKSQTESF